MEREWVRLAPRGLMPAARAAIRGGEGCPGLAGTAWFYPWAEGTLVEAQVSGFPGDGFYPMHIHTFGDCRTGGDVAFLQAGEHFSHGGDHPDHAGDLPDLLASGGRAAQLCFTGRFTPGEVIGRSVILHGAGGERMACGVIQGCRRRP